MKQEEKPIYWRPVQHSMTRRCQQNNYHSGGKAYMITLHIEDHAPLFGRIDATGQTLFPLGEAARTAWLSLPQRFHNISIIDSPEEFVIMPEHFHGIIYVTGYMQEHLSEIERLFKARIAMAYRKLLIESEDKGSSNDLYAVGTSIQWLQEYRLQQPHIKTATAAWVDRQLAVLCSATCCGTQQDPPPFKLSTSGKRTKQGFLFATGYTDSMLLDADNLEGHRQYIFNNPESRRQRSANRQMLKVSRLLIDTAVSIPALEGYLRKECNQRDVVQEKLDAVRKLLLVSAEMSLPHTIGCHSYGDRRLLQQRMLPIVCHRKYAHLFPQQKARCIDEAAKGAVMVSAAISQKEREIFNAVQDAGYPVIKIEDNGFPEIYHPSKERIDLCDAGRLLIVSPWQYHYRHKDESIYVTYCKTMNCIAQAICRLKDTWWMQ